MSTLTVRTLNKLIADGERVTINGSVVVRAKSLYGVIEFLTRNGVEKREAKDAVVEIEKKQVTVEPTYRRTEK